LKGKKPEWNRNRNQKVPPLYFISTAFTAAPPDVGAGTTGVSLTVVVPSSITGFAVLVNQTNPATGAIIVLATGLTINAGDQKTFAVFLTPTQPITLDLVNHRITLQ
jgi:hypothetical protein